MKKIALLICVLPMVAHAETDAEIELASALNNARAQCAGITNELAPLKTMVTAGTAVNAAGTAVGAGGVIAGEAKWKQDKQIVKTKFRIQVNQEVLNSIQDTVPNKIARTNFKGAPKDIDWSKLGAEIGAYLSKARQYPETEKQAMQSGIAAEQKRMADMQKKADVLGGIRTGLFATNTATNVAGAVISAKTGTTEQLTEKIRACASAIQNLNAAQTRVRFEDGESANQELLNTTKSIVDACGEYTGVDLTSIKKLARGGIITGAVGAATGAAATATSVVDTKMKRSDIDLTDENSLKQDKKQGAYMAASHALGGAAAASSLVGTILNIKQIKNVKQVISVAENCEEALK